MTTFKFVTTRTNKQILPPDKHQKRFSLESEGFLFDKTKRNLSVLGRRDGKPLLCPRALPARRQAPAAVGRLVDFWAR